MDDAVARQSILRQYRAGLQMLGRAIELCPEELWLSDEYRNRFWHIAYHAIFYTHLYVQPSEMDFEPWAGHKPNSNYFGSPPWAKDKPFKIPEPYRKGDVREYLELCRGEVEKHTAAVQLDESSGFSWLPFDKLELQFYNIRHLQHHTGQLSGRLRDAAQIGVGWVGSVPEA